MQIHTPNFMTFSQVHKSPMCIYKSFYKKRNILSWMEFNITAYNITKCYYSLNPEGTRSGLQK